MEPAHLEEASQAARPTRTLAERLGRQVLWWGIGIGALCFGFKIVEFIHTLDSPEAPGFAVVPVTTYFVVAAGYVLLFCWAFVTGQLDDLERPKMDLLKKEEELDRLEAHT